MTCARPPNRTGRHDRARQRGKSDTLDSERIARETLAHPLLPRAFKRAGDQVGPDEHTELLTVWWQARCAMIKRRQQLLSESEALLRDLPLELIERLPDATAVRPRLAALARVTRRRRFTPPTALRITFLERYRAEVARLDAEEKALTHRLAELVHHSGSTLDELCGLSTVSVAKLLPRSATRAVSTRWFCALQRDRAAGRVDRRGAWRTGPPPSQSRRQPADQRDPLPDGDHPAALPAARPAHLRQRSCRGSHQDGGPSHRQATPLRRCPRMVRGPGRAPRPGLLGAEPRADAAQSRGGPTGPSEASRVAASLDGDRLAAREPSRKEGP